MPAGNPPKGLDGIWHIMDLSPGISGMEVESWSLMTFANHDVTSRFDAAFNGNIPSDKRKNPKRWGRWKTRGCCTLKIDWNEDGRYRGYEHTEKSRPGKSDERLDGCWASSRGYTVGIMGGIGGGTASFSTNTWCFAKNGRFSNDRATSISGSSTTGTSTGRARNKNAGFYRIDGHVLQLIYDDGRKARTSIGFVKGKKRPDLLVGRGRFK